MMSKEELNKQLESALNLILFAVEQSISNGSCEFATEEAFENYERIRIEIFKLKGESCDE
jgi:hypothetical protein